MIAWPYQADQMLNAILLDQVLGVAIRINTGGGWSGDMISSERFERAIRTLMVEPAGETALSKARNASGVIEKALRPGGSSRTNLESFVLCDIWMLRSHCSKRPVRSETSRSR